ncbi:hypothetical protein, partial [Elizabethkingia argenteiflava]|uniref:hypothetical protein n=1 Tax=Elizabethkingia argenteiflava TaxID=2681556 RepID=UPI001BB4483F
FFIYFQWASDKSVKYMFLKFYHFKERNTKLLLDALIIFFSLIFKQALSRSKFYVCLLFSPLSYAGMSSKIL